MLTRLERLALDVFPEPGVGVEAAADWLRDHLRSEIAKRLRAEANGNGRWVSETCLRCGRGTPVSQNRPRDEPIVCSGCRREDAADPVERDRAWVERIPPSRLDGLLVAVRSLR